ncbi:MAG: nucleotidyltransferase domain-containing protein [Thaumarchaeota archaeon]|nr:nucleotidyltransferase domain-containing protein [Nitrososphaerota archaeon]
MATDPLAFVTPTYMKILRIFLSDPVRQYHEREVARRSGASSGSANKLLRLMARADMLDRQSRGRMVLYSLNLGNPVAKQFKVLYNVSSLEGLLSKLKPFTKRVILYGSCSTGTDVRESDIDIMVLTDERQATRREIAKFNAMAERQVAPIIVDANEFARLRRLDKPLYDNVERGIVLWESQ